MKILYYRNILIKTGALKYSSQPKSTNKYSHTVLLPNTKFPLRLEGQKIIERDKYYNNVCKGLYAWQSENKSGDEFVLHDGPPYANGAPHMGHAINKILKDTIIRAKLLEGRKVEYVPGWDCHGLPIELKAITNSKKQLEPLNVRRIARNFAGQTIEKQKETFQSWGVMGDWENAYKTFNKNYIQNQMRQFYKLYEKNLIYRDFKPVYWSPSSRTALAEAELEYNEKHKSQATTVRLKVTQSPNELKKYKSIYLCIWTTTPWTLPSNQAVCYNNDLNYSLIEEDGSDNTYIVATDLIPAHSKMLQKQFIVLESFSGSILNSVKYKHPIYDEELPLMHSSHATATKGTGLVHTAPAHGPEDFLVALNNNIVIKSMVDEAGEYTEEAGFDLKGLEVLGEGTEKVLKMLGDDVLNVETFEHSYPYDWRTKKPVILRASMQWFLDTNAVKKRAVELLDDVEIIPKINKEIYKKTLVGQLTKRPYWCISRQRCWGVPIPVFYNKATKQPIISSELIEHLCGLIEEDLDYWWKLPIEQLFPEKICDKLNIQMAEIEKGQDILDIWFDSGMSWSSVLKNDQVADMYLEGVDQFTGWFQSSLITSVALRDKLPYKSIYVHGFALDENGLKMSKSLGNVIDPDDITKGIKKQKPYGVDTLRWWVACHANQDATAHVSKNVLQASAEEVQKIRSVIRFSLGCLSDYNEILDYSNLKFIDKYLLHSLYNFHQQSEIYLKNYQFNKLCTAIINLSANQLSALYYTAVKDRIYCDDANSVGRKSGQYVMYQIFNILTRSIAPIVPHLAEEFYHHFKLKQSEIFFQQKPLRLTREWLNDDVDSSMKIILSIRQDINKLKLNTMEQDVTIAMNNSSSFEPEELCDILQVASVKLVDNEVGDNYKIIKVVKTAKFNCERCRRCTSNAQDDLCRRCKMIVENLCDRRAVN